MTTRSMLFLLAAAVVACTPKLDQKKLEGEIQAHATEKLVDVKAVTCPEVELKKDSKFECTLEDNGGTKGTIDCVVTGDEKNPVTWTLRGEIENLEVVGDVLEKGLSQKENMPVDVQCPKKGILVQKGVSFTCKAVVGNPGETKTINYSFVAGSDKGDWQITKQGG